MTDEEPTQVVSATEETIEFKPDMADGDSTQAVPAVEDIPGMVDEGLTQVVPTVDMSGLVDVEPTQAAAEDMFDAADVETTQVVPAADMFDLTDEEPTQVTPVENDIFEFEPDSALPVETEPIFEESQTQLNDAFASAVDRRSAEDALWGNVAAELHPLPDDEPVPVAAPTMDYEPPAAMETLASASFTPATQARFEHEEREAQKHGKRTAIAVAVVLAVIALAFGGLYFFISWQNTQQQEAARAQEAEDERIAAAAHPVKIAITTGGWDTSAGASRLPVRIQGTDVSKNDVDEVQYVTSDGQGLELRQGEYSLTVPASPISADGTIYNVSNTTVEVLFTSKDVNEQIDATGKGEFTLSAIAALDVTDAQITSAYEYAQKDTTDGAPNAATLKDAATKRRDDAVAAEKVKERQITTGSFVFTVPEYWVGRIVYAVDGDDLYIYSQKYQDLEVCHIGLKGSSVSSSDDGTDPIGKVSLSDGKSVALWSYNYSYYIANARVNGDTSHMGADFSDEMAAEIVDLQTGGTATYLDMLTAVQNEDTQKVTELSSVQADYIVKTVGGAIAARS